MLIEIFTLLCGIALSVTGSFTFWPVQHWYDFYIPVVLLIGGYFLGLGLVMLIIFITGLFIDGKKKYTKINPLARFWFTQSLYYINRHSLVIPKIQGEELIPQHQRFVLICNHRSDFDAMLIADHFKKFNIAFITKQSNKKIPWGGRLLNGLCYLPINRDDKLQSLTQFKRAINLLNTNTCSIGVFPEGYRQHEKPLTDFHEGCFNIAIKAGVPIVIATTRGMDQINKNMLRKVSKVGIDILGVIPPEDIQDKPSKEVSDMVHKIMFDHLRDVYVK